MARKFILSVSAMALLSGTPATAVPTKDTVQEHFKAAAKASGTEHVELYNMLCPRIADPNAGKIAAPPNVRAESTWFREPAKVFDNLYYLGEKTVWESSPSAWAVTTPAGIIIVDTGFGNSVKTLIDGGLRKLGLNPADIKYVVIGHAHGDHFGGAKYLQEAFHARVISSDADWKMMEEGRNNFGGPPPKRDMIIKDGDTLTLGGETLRFYVTPGHTPGTISSLIPVTDHGVPHLVAEWGGTGFSFLNYPGIDDAGKQRWFKTYAASAARFRDIVARSGADALIANHPILDRTEIKLQKLQQRKPGDPNPWVIGKDRVQAYLTVAEECARAGAASFR